MPNGDDNASWSVSRRKFTFGAFLAWALVKQNTNRENNSEYRSEAKRLISKNRNINYSDLEFEIDFYPYIQILNKRLYVGQFWDRSSASSERITLDEDLNRTNEQEVIRQANRKYKRLYGKKSETLQKKISEINDSDMIGVRIWTEPIDYNEAEEYIRLREKVKNSAGLPNNALEELRSERKRRIDQKNSVLVDELKNISDRIVIKEPYKFVNAVDAELLAKHIHILENIPIVEKISMTNKPTGNSLDDSAGTHETGNCSGSTCTISYDATGIPLGMYEANGYSEREASANREGSYGLITTGERNDHATLVAEAMASYDNELPGTAYNADLYEAYNFSNDEANKLNWFANLSNGGNGVVAVNMSLWQATDTELTNRMLTDQDQLIDSHVFNSDQPVVVDAGNETDSPEGSNVTSEIVGPPARGFNTITVGNINNYGNIDRIDDEVFSSSKYKNPDSYASNPNNGVWPHQKPELCAVGTNVSTPSATPNVSDTGTSYAAPAVTGSIGLMKKFADQYTNDNIENIPYAVKAILLASSTKLPQDGIGPNDKWGAGTLRVDRIEKIIERGNYKFAISGNGGIQTNDITATTDDVIQVGCAWPTPVNYADGGENRADTNFALRLLGNNDNPVESSPLLDRNWQMVHYEIPFDGTNDYTIQIENTRDNSGGRAVFVFWAWDIRKDSKDI
jgi:hypothetical protein